MAAIAFSVRVYTSNCGFYTWTQKAKTLSRKRAKKTIHFTRRKESMKLAAVRSLVASTFIAVMLFSQLMPSVVGAQKEAPPKISEAIPIDLNLRVNAMISISEETLRGLQNLGASLTGNASLLVAQATGELSRVLNDFKQLTRDHVEAPLKSLSSSIQDAARQLYSATARLNEILSLQQKCFFQNLQSVLAALQNTALELKAFPLAPSSRPRLYYLQFDNQPPSIVPKEGGNFTVFGFKVWKDNGPVVSLWDENKQTIIKALTVSRAAGDNSFAANIDSDTIKNTGGRCLQLRVQLNQRKPNEDLYMPVCVPKYSSMQFKVTAGYQYKCPRTEQITADKKNYTRYNESCENRLPIGEAMIWDIPSDCSIIDKKDDNVGDRNTNQVQWTISGRNSITASGWIDTASCVDVKVPCPTFTNPFRLCTIGRKLLHSTVYNHNITPTLSCRVIDKKIVETRSPVTVDAVFPQTRMFVSLDADCDSSENNFWFTVTPVIDGVEQAKFESGNIPIGGEGGTAPVGIQKGYTIDASFNPRSTKGKVQLALTLSFPSCQ
jgi:hypothetical protein